MGAPAANWAWENSRATNGPLLVMMAIAFESDEKGECVMSVAELARKARLSDRAVQNATPVLVSLGELAVVPRVADGGRHLYRLMMVDNSRTGADSAPAEVIDHARTGADSAPVQILRGEDISPVRPGTQLPDHSRTGAESAPLVMVDNSRTGAESAPLDEKLQVAPSSPSPSARISNDLDLGSVVSGRRSKPSSSEPPREDVERLCALLADRIEANGSRRPSVTGKWRDSARRMIDIDGRTEEQVTRAIDWCQKDEFWHRNILSMPKLREQYDRLRLAWLADQRKKSQPSQHRNPDDDYAAAMQRIQARKESANGAGGNGHDSAPRQVSLPPAAN